MSEELTEEPLRPTTSYEQFRIKGTERTTWILLHTIIPAYTVVDQPPSFGGQPQVIDHPACQPLDDLGLHRMRQADATAGVSHQLLASLTSDELKQVAYWAPETVGQLVWNFWD